MRHSRTLTFMARKWILYPLIILLSTSKSQSQTEDNPSASLLCISDCETCPVICSPPPSHSPSPPVVLKLPPPPPPPEHHYSPPQQPYYFTSPSPSLSPPAHPPPPPPAPGGAPPPRPSVYVYNPGTTTPPSGTGQRNFSYPYYYFYASRASPNYLSQGSILLTFFSFFRILYGY
ncbi:hypothetical protein ACS0TY_022049 [Phlomoides rotata]